MEEESLEERGGSKRERAVKLLECQEASEEAGLHVSRVGVARDVTGNTSVV